MFDKAKPHGEVSGTGVAGARFYQDGNYYDATHKYVFSNPGATPPAGKQARTMEQAEASYQQRLKAQEQGQPVSEEEKAPAKDPAAPPPLPPENNGGDTPLTREQRLAQMNVPKLQELQIATLQALNPEADLGELKKQMIKGPGAKDKLVEWLAKNTSE
jgi:hypothetical protein